MAGISNQGIFHEKISPFLAKKMELIALEKGKESSDYNALYLQYVKLENEYKQEAESNERHWQADLHVSEDTPKGVERLYSKSMVIEPTMICAAHCRYCLRANYHIFTLTEDELLKVAKFCGSEWLKNDLSEVLITGGDPLVIPKRLSYLIEEMLNHAPNVKIMRIATRLFSQDPTRIDKNVFEMFRRFNKDVKFEIATQINHPAEFFPETIEKIEKILEIGIKIYSQNVLLKGINDDIETLTELYRKMRFYDLEAHYLFHSVPMKGMHHFRTTVKKGVELAKALTNSGRISGRVKPMYAVMTDIGKITLYDGTILDKNEEENRVLLQSAYKYEERMKWNPSWQLPKNAYIDNNGYIRVWYLDGID